VIGNVATSQPAFDSNPNHRTLITQNSGAFIARSTHTAQYGWDFSAGAASDAGSAWLGLKSVSTYTRRRKSHGTGRPAAHTSGYSGEVD
jgi:hypothetical protein